MAPNGSSEATNSVSENTSGIFWYVECTPRAANSTAADLSPDNRHLLQVYPQGCDVCNHLSLFLCVADYDKLLPGTWRSKVHSWTADSRLSAARHLQLAVAALLTTRRLVL